MKKKHQNIFFLFGIAVLILMVSQLDFNEVIDGLTRAGYWFVAVIALWIFLYILNTAAWYVIIHNKNSWFSLLHHHHPFVCKNKIYSIILQHFLK